MLHYIQDAFMSCNYRFRNKPVTWLWCIFSEISRYASELWLKEENKKIVRFLRSSSYGEWSIRAGSPRFPEVREIFDVSRILVIYSNVGKTAGLAESDILLEITSCLAHPLKLLGKMDMWLHGKN